MLDLIEWFELCIGAFSLEKIGLLLHYQFHLFLGGVENIHGEKQGWTLWFSLRYELLLTIYVLNEKKSR